MKQKGVCLLLGCLLVLALPGLVGASDHYKVLNGPEHFYYGHISYTEAAPEGSNPVVLREGRAVPEVAVVNLPLGPGDTVRTTADRRCEIQFDSGTIVRLDVNTELKIGTILAQSLSSSSRLSSLELNRGRIYVMYKQYDSREMFQVLTPSAAVRLNHQTVAMLSAAADGSTEAQVKTGKVNLMFGSDAKTLKTETVRKMQRATVRGTQAERAAYAAGSDFELWNDRINADFVDLHKGESALPKPVQKLPEAVFYFAQRYGSIYGEWLWDDMYGYVWRPYRDRQDSSGWSPFYMGTWTYVGNQLFWVPGETWGWVPYHLGIWQWDKKLGWVWLPGSFFAPAWADWEFFYGYAGWRPWSLFDWFEGYSTDFMYGGGGWFYGLPGINGIVPGSGAGAGAGPVVTTIGVNQLKQPGGSVFAIPKELKSVAQRVLRAYRAGDPRVIESMKQVPAETVFVSRADLNKPGLSSRAVSWANVPKPELAPPSSGRTAVLPQPPSPGREAAITFRRDEFIQQFAGKAVGPERPHSAGGGRPAAGTAASAVSMRPAEHPRFLDWNPDVKVARELGVRIEYSSAKNEVRCPELRLSSADRERGGAFSPRMTSGGLSFEPSAGGAPGSYVPGRGGMAPSSSAGAHPSGSANSSGSSSSGSNGKIKN
jgi:hypothetical protein